MKMLYLRFFGKYKIISILSPSKNKPRWRANGSIGPDITDYEKYGVKLSGKGIWCTSCETMKEVHNIAAEYSGKPL